MSNEQSTAPASLRVAAVGVLTALTVVIGLVRVPLPATQGYFTLADVAILCAAYALGPFSAALAGGIGAAILDLVGGYAQYAPTSLVVHGLEGLVAGLLALLAARGGLRVAAWILAGAAAMAIVAGGYLAAETFIYLGVFQTALLEVPFNLAQAGVGAVGGALLAVAVARAYPPVSRLRW